MPGRLELTVKFSELPRPLKGRDGVTIGIPTGAGLVTASVPATVWRKLEQAAKDYPHWVAALSGSLARFAEGEIILQHPALQIFEKKARPEAVAAGKGPEPEGPALKAPDAKASAPKAPDSNGPAVEVPKPKGSESKASAPNALDVNASAVKKPEGRASAAKAPDRNTLAAPPSAPPYPTLSLKGRGAAKTG